MPCTGFADSCIGKRPSLCVSMQLPLTCCYRLAAPQHQDCLVHCGRSLALGVWRDRCIIHVTLCIRFSPAPSCMEGESTHNPQVLASSSSFAGCDERSQEHLSHLHTDGESVQRQTSPPCADFMQGQSPTPQQTSCSMISGKGTEPWDVKYVMPPPPYRKPFGCWGDITQPTIEPEPETRPEHANMKANKPKRREAPYMSLASPMKAA